MIKINKIKLKNFTCIDEADLDLSNDSFILILGENGSGKSSLLEAIAICFAERKKSSSYNEYVKLGTKECTIYMEATIHNEPITFDCRIESKAAALYRTITWKDKKYINSECSKLLDELNLTFYSDIIFAMQAESDLVGMTPVQRSKLFREIFNFKFEEELSKLDADIENAKNNINVLTGKIEVAQSTLKSMDLNNNFNEVPLPFTEDEYKNKLNEMDLLEESIENSKKQNEGYQIVVNLVKDKEASVKEIQSDIERVISLQKLNASKIEEYIDNKELHKSKVEDRQAIEGTLSILKSKKDALTKDLEGFNKELVNANSNKVSIETVINDLKYKQALILNGSCPTCGKDYTSADNTKVAKELDDKNSELNTALDSIKKIETFISSNKSQLREIESEIEKTSKALYDINFKISELNKSLSKDLSELESEKQNLIDKYELLNNRLKNEEVDLDEASNLLEGYSLSIVDTSKLSHLMDEIMSYQNAVEKNQQLVKDKIQWEETKKNQQLSLEEFTHQLNTVKIELKNNMEVKDLINNKFTNYIIVGVCSTLTNEMNKFIQAIFPNIKVVVTLLNKGIGIHYYPTNSSEKSISSKMASGFQKELISLSFRVALCKMHGMSFSFFDEIDSSSSQKNSEIVMNYLMTSSIFNQLFFITQKKTTVDYIVYNFPDVALIQAKNGKLEKLSYNND